jgi:hypothetical protein
VVGARELIELLLGVSVLMRVAQSTALLLRMMGRVGMLLENAVIVRRYASCCDLEFSIVWQSDSLRTKTEAMKRQKKSVVSKALRRLHLTKLQLFSLFQIPIIYKRLLTPYAKSAAVKGRRRIVAFGSLWPLFTRPKAFDLRIFLNFISFHSLSPSAFLATSHP